MLPRVLSLYKPAGLTPLQTLDHLREIFLEYRHAKLSYVGRLDPMAEGVMLVLVDEENYERAKYLSLPKTYEAEILFGVSTDTGDMLGFVANSTDDMSGFNETLLRERLESLVGTSVQEYPRFSSPKIAGKQSFSKTVTITALEFLSSKKVSREFLHTDSIRRIGMVNGDFRQEETIKKWSEYFAAAPSEFYIISIRVESSSGLYIRVLAERIGALVGLPALAYTIKRTKVGTYGADEALRVD